MCKIKVNVFHKACKAVILAQGTDAYAKAHAQVGLGVWDAYNIALQCVYLLHNVSGWTGETARQCRAVFRRYSRD